MTSAVSGMGSVLVWNYRKVVEQVKITGVSEAMEAIDASSHDSPSGFREFIAGMADGGEISMEGNLIVGDSGGQIAFHTDLQAKTGRTVWLVAPMAVGSALLLSGIATGFEMDFPFDKQMSVSGKLKVSGLPTLYVAQSVGISAMTGIQQQGGAAITIAPTVAAGTYAYTTTVNTASTWVKLTVTAASHTIYIQGTAVASGVQSGEIPLGAAGTTTDIFIMVYEANKAPRLYILTVTRP